MLSTAALVSLIALVGVVREVESKLSDRSVQSLCIARVQGDFDKHIGALVTASVSHDIATVNVQAEALRTINDRLDQLDKECPTKGAP